MAVDQAQQARVEHFIERRVTPRDDLERELSAIADAAGAELRFQRPFRGYAQYAVLTFPPEPGTP
jgi:S-adenosylmethionine-diacylgycerolhomoserine-N-methlytransferase